MGAFWETTAFAAKQAALAGSGSAQTSASETAAVSTVFTTLTLGVGAAAVEITVDGTGGLLINGNALKITSLPTTQPASDDAWVQLWNNGGEIVAG